jgi:hypothetical protein
MSVDAELKKFIYSLPNLKYVQIDDDMDSHEEESLLHKLQDSVEIIRFRSGYVDRIGRNTDPKTTIANAKRHQYFYQALGSKVRKEGLQRLEVWAA